MFDVRKIAAVAADRIELRQCNRSTSADTLSFVPACALALSLIATRAVEEVERVSTDGFARIWRDPKCGNTPCIAGRRVQQTRIIFRAPGWLRDTGNTLSRGVCTSFWSTIPPRDFGSDVRVFVKIEAHRPIVDHSVHSAGISLRLITIDR
jgi:hypothetical protein